MSYITVTELIQSTLTATAPATINQFIALTGLNMFGYPNYCLDWMKAKQQNNPNKKYRYMITFTLDPKKSPSPTEAKQWILRNVINPLHRPHEVYYAEELTQAGVPHWHVVGSYLKPIKKSLFKYYQTKFGLIDFSPMKGGNDLTSGIAYISKEELPTKLL